MNILILNAGRGWGGIESHSVTLSSALIKRGHRVIIACSDDGNVRHNAVAAGLPVSNLKVLNACDIISILKIIRLASKENIDIILANLGKEYWPGAVAAMFLGKRIIFVRHQTDRIRKTTRWLINNHADVVAVSAAVKDALLVSGIKREKIHMVHNAVSLDRFNPSRIDRKAVRRELGVSEKDSLVGTVGKLHKGKGVYELLGAVAAIAKENAAVRLVFAGDGEEREKLEEEAERLGIRDMVIFTGLVKDVERIYAAMDIFVLPSNCSEAFGMVIIEAMAMGKPVIGTIVGGIPELITDGKNGIIVPPGDKKALAAAIREYLRDSDLSSRMAAAGRQAAESDFSDEGLGKRFEEVLETLKKL